MLNWAVYFLKSDIIKKDVWFVVLINKVCSVHIEKKLLMGALETLRFITSPLYNN